MDEKLLGTTEEILLTGIRELGDDAYGLRLHEWLEEVTGKSYSVGTIYTTARRLQDRGYIGSEERIVERRPRRYYWLEAVGHRALAAQEEMRARMRRASAAGLRPRLEPGR